MTTKKQYRNFDELLATAGTPVLVDFYAPWCGPCQMMAQILEDLKKQMGDRLQIAKINTDTYPTTASQYRVQALPTLVLFNQGQVVDRIEGVVRVEQLAQWLQHHGV